MVATDKVFGGSIPETYERFLVPIIFQSYAIDLAERVAKSKPQVLLETAAGTAVLTRAMASRLPVHAHIVATFEAFPVAFAGQFADNRQNRHRGHSEEILRCAITA